MNHIRPNNAAVDFVDRHYGAMLTRGQEAQQGSPTIYMNGITEGVVLLPPVSDIREGYAINTIKLPLGETPAHDKFASRGFSPEVMASGIWVVKGIARNVSGIDIPTPPWAQVLTYAHYDADTWHTATTPNIHGPVNEDVPAVEVSTQLETAIARIAQESVIFHDMAVSFRTDAALYEAMQKEALNRTQEEPNGQDPLQELYMRALFTLPEQQSATNTMHYRYAYAHPEPALNYFSSFELSTPEPETSEEIVALALGQGQHADTIARSLPLPFPAYNQNIV